MPRHVAGKDEAILEARRRLLRLGVYIAPAVLGTLLIGRDALAQVASCGPAGCRPNTSPCAPSPCRPRP
jgi:hypothetical protein